jgi:hypothetical protein
MAHMRWTVLIRDVVWARARMVGGRRYIPRTRVTNSLLATIRARILFVQGQELPAGEWVKRQRGIMLLLYGSGLHRARSYG